MLRSRAPRYAGRGLGLLHERSFVECNWEERYLWIEMKKKGVNAEGRSECKRKE